MPYDIMDDCVADPTGFSLGYRFGGERMPVKYRQVIARIAVITGAGVLVTTCMVAPAAASGPEPASTAKTQDVTVQGGWVSTWINGNVRYGPSTDYDINYAVGSGFTSYGLCWKHGGWVSANGVAHDKWVKLSDSEWIWGGLLNGDDTGGVTNTC